MGHPPLTSDATVQVARLNSKMYDLRWIQRKRQLYGELRKVRIDLDTLEQARASLC